MVSHESVDLFHDLGSIVIDSIEYELLLDNAKSLLEGDEAAEDTEKWIINSSGKIIRYSVGHLRIKWTYSSSGRLIRDVLMFLYISNNCRSVDAKEKTIQSDLPSNCVRAMNNCPVSVISRDGTNRVKVLPL